MICLGLSVFSQEVNPLDSSWIQFFGLGFSVLFCINLTFFVILVFKKHLFLILPLLGIIYALPTVKNYFKIFPKSEFSKADKEELKLLTYNVRIFNTNENLNGNMRDSIFNMMSKLDLNLVCFQEFYYAEEKGKFDTKSIVQEELGLINVNENYTHHMTGGLHSGTAMFTSLPVLNKGVISFESDANNNCIFMDVTIGSDTVRVYNGHLSSIRFQGKDYEFLHHQEESLDLSERGLSGYKRIGELMNRAYKKRVTQLQKVLDHIYNCPYPVVFAGDFNDTPVSFCYAQTRNYLTDSFVESGCGIGNTYIGEFPSFRIDYVFHSDEIESAKYTTLDYHFSDHKPVYCKLRVKPI